jgi:hypothetical protein
MQPSGTEAEGTGGAQTRNGPLTRAGHAETARGRRSDAWHISRGRAAPTLRRAAGAPAAGGGARSQGDPQGVRAVRRQPASLRARALGAALRRRGPRRCGGVALRQRRPGARRRRRRWGLRRAVVPPRRRAVVAPRRRPVVASRPRPVVPPRRRAGRHAAARGLRACARAAARGGALLFRSFQPAGPHTPGDEKLSYSAGSNSSQTSALGSAAGEYVGGRGGLRMSIAPLGRRRTWVLSAADLMGSAMRRASRAHGVHWFPGMRCVRAKLERP